MKYDVHLEHTAGVTVEVEADNEADARKNAEALVADWSVDHLPEMWPSDFVATEVEPHVPDVKATDLVVLTQENVDLIDRTIRKLVKKIGPKFDGSDADARMDAVDEFVESVTFAIVHEIENYEA